MASCAIDCQPEESVVQQLSELFGDTLTMDVIRSVAASCKFDVTKSSNRLLEMMSANNGNIAIEMDNLNLWRISDAKNRSSRSSVPLLNRVQGEPKKSKRALDIEKAIKSILKGYKVLVIMRGLPGSGKSYLSKYILESTVGYTEEHHLHILSTDDFFAQKGFYEFDSTLLGNAHNWNQSRAFDSLRRGVSPVIIDNTNTQIWEMQPYATMAIDYGYLIEILEPDTHWCFNDKELTKRNRHGVPKSKIIDMLGRYEKNVTPMKLLSTYNLSYNLQKPPQLRLYPPPNVSVTNSIKTKVTVEASNVQQLANGATSLNHQSEEVKPIETIDLMEFNDDDSPSNNKNKPLSSITDFRVDHLLNNASTQQNIVDDILMTSNDSTATNILQPEQKPCDTITIDSSDEEEEVKRTKQLFPDISSWGINENYIRSWDIVTPIDEFPKITLSPKSKASQKVITKDSSTNVDKDDFELWNDPKGYKLLETLNRDINRGTPKREQKIPKKPLLDKSCMTDDIYEDYENHMGELKSLFPSVSDRHLDYWYNKCKGDLEWTIEFLLEAKEAEITCIEDPSKSEKAEEQPNSSHSSDENNEPTTKKSSKPKVRKFTSEAHSDLKKFIESKVDINPQNYSKHVLRIKQFKFSKCNDDQQATTSKDPSTPKDKANISDVISLDSDSDMEFESVYSDTMMEDKPEATVELNLGDHFVTQLENQFADPNISYPKGFQPVVQVPLTLARQLYTFYIESVFQQMETQNQIMEELTREDEEFAKKLHAIEEAEMQAAQMERPPMSFKEIMKEQEELAQHQKKAEKWKLLNPDDIAARLTRQKLFANFPTIDQDTLVEILYAHDNKYQDTVESLLASTGSDNKGKINSDIKKPPIMEEVLEEMRDAFKHNISEDYTEAHQATFYREEASKFLKKRSDLYQKAQQYHQRGMNEVAQYYSCLASQQTNYYERANNMAATAFLDEHAKRLEDFNTLDLHFLYVKEAIPALDVFLDRNINLLRHSQTAKQTEYLHIITGRGNHSENGRPKLKPVVMNHLVKRKINFVPLNPGLLKVKITKNSSLTSELY